MQARLLSPPPIPPRKQNFCGTQLVERKHFENMCSQTETKEDSSCSALEDHSGMHSLSSMYHGFYIGFDQNNEGSPIPIFFRNVKHLRAHTEILRRITLMNLEQLELYNIRESRY